jgi:hypothetical protein
VDNMTYSDRQGGYACDDCYNDRTVINSYHSGPRPLLWLSPQIVRRRRVGNRQGW